MVEALRQRLSQEVLLSGMEEERVAVLAQATLQTERQAAVVGGVLPQQPKLAS